MSNFLENTHLRKLENKAQIISVSAGSSLPEAWEKLVNHHVYSLPVYEPDSKKFVGLLSLHSVVRRLISLFGEKCGGADHIPSHQFTAKDVADVQYAFNTCKVSEDLVTKVETMKPGINIQDAINFFVAPGHDESQIRLPIVDEDGSIANIVSPTMIIKFLSQHLDALPADLINKHIANVPGVISPNVRTIKSTDRALDAFALMMANHFSALGIEDHEAGDHRHILSIVTMKDAGHAIKDLARLLSPVEEYVNEIRRQDLVDRAPTMNVPQNATLAATIQKFVAVKRHRMFVRGVGGHSNDLVGLITVSDSLKAFSNSGKD